MRRLIAMPILALASLAGCALPAARAVAPIAPASTPAAKPACVGDRIWFDENQDVDCDVTPPQELDIHMLVTGDPIARCLDMGGEPIEWPTTWWQVRKVDCEKVDY